MKLSTLSLTLASVLLLVLAGCTDPDAPIPATAEQLNAQVASAGITTVPEEKDETSTSTTLNDTQSTRTTQVTHDRVDNLDSITYLGLNDDIVWPGSLIRGDQINSFVYNPITIDRAPLTLSVSLEGSTNTGSDLTRTVADPKLSTVRQGISELLKSAITAETKVPAKVDFSYQRVYNESQMSLEVGADISYGAGSLKTQFDWSDTTKSTKILAQYKQFYYSIDMDTPASPARFLADSVTLEEAQLAFPAGSMPVYVAGVSYGMMAMMCIETSASESDMKASLEAAYKGAVDLEINAEYTAKEILENSNIKIVVYGGSTAGLNDLEEGYAGFLNVINASKDFGSDTPGVPLAYKFRHLADNTLAQVSLTSQYSITTVIRLKQRVKIQLDNITCTMADDEGPDDTVNMDRFTWNLKAYNVTGPNDTEPVAFYDQTPLAWSTAGEYDMDSGTVWTPDPTIATVEFNTNPEQYDFSLAKLRMYGYARDYDSGSANEDGSRTVDVLLQDILDNNGSYHFSVDSSDFTMQFNFTVSLTD